eukprot:XP_011680361.1 PREDICTED: monocarboxylate transporter 2-like [Strongylocentrotus purpuratus]
MAPTQQLNDSQDPWRYAIVLSKFLVLFVDGGMAKSFGVLIPEMVDRYDSDYKTIAFICSLHSLMFMTAPIANVLLKVMKPRTLGIFGGLLTSISIMCAPLANSVFELGVLISLTGFGIVMAVFSTLVTLARFFPNSFIFSNSLTQFGAICGVFTVPIIVERSLEAYGYDGACLILGGISLHAVVSAMILRPPKDLPSRTEENTQLMDAHPPSDSHSIMENEEHQGCSYWGTESDNDGFSRSNTQYMQAVVDFFHSLPSVGELFKSFILVEEPLCTLVMPAVFLANYVFYAWLLFLVPHAEDFGIEPSRAVLLSSIAGIAGTFGSIVFVVLLHFNYDSTIIIIFCCSMSAISFCLDTLSSSFMFLAIMACFQGLFLFVLQSVTSVMAKLAVRDAENIPSALSLFFFIEAVGIGVGDTISGTYT